MRRGDGRWVLVGVALLCAAVFACAVLAFVAYQLLIAPEASR